MMRERHARNWADTYKLQDEVFQKRRRNGENK